MLETEHRELQKVTIKIDVSDIDQNKFYDKDNLYGTNVKVVK